MKKNVSIQIIRILSMLMIVACHVFSSMTNYYLIALSQFLSIGVYIFLFISGFLYGGKEINSYKKMYIDKIKKLLIPVWIFILFVIIYNYIVINNIINIKYIFIYILNIQGFFKGINGLGHLWFLTPLMICYLCLLFLKKIKNNKSFWILCSFLLLLSMVSCILNTKISLYGFYILTFILGYTYKNNMKNLKIISKNFIWCMLIIISSFLRIIVNKIYDNSIIYDSLCVPITSIIICLGLFVIIYNITVKIKTNKLIDFLDGLSFYIYICHYSFIVGPFFVLNQKSLYIGLPLVIFMSIISGIILKKLHFLIIYKKKEGEIV